MVSCIYKEGTIVKLKNCAGKQKYKVLASSFSGRGEYKLKNVNNLEIIYVRFESVIAVTPTWKYERGQHVLLRVPKKVIGGPKQTIAGTITERLRDKLICKNFYKVDNCINVAEEEGDLIPIPRLPKFEAGDVIRTTGGELVTITQLESYRESKDGFAYTVRKSDGWHVMLMEYSIAYVEPSETPQFKIGDTVKNTTNRYQGRVIKVRKLVDGVYLIVRINAELYRWSVKCCQLVAPEKKVRGCQHTDLRKRRYSDTYICCEMLKTHAGKPGVFACGVVLEEIPRDGIARYVNGTLQVLPTRKRRVTDADMKQTKERIWGEDSTQPIIKERNRAEAK